MKLLKPTTSVIMALVLGLAMLVAPVSSASAHDVPGSTLDTRNKGWILDMYTLINDHRISNGLNPLRFNATASEVAEDWADVTLRNGNSAHGGTSKTDPRVVGRAIRTGENVAGEIIGNLSARTILQGWINSPAHNAALLYPDFEVMGLGFNHTETGTMYAVAQFYQFKAGQEPVGTFDTAADFFANTGTLTVDPGTPFSVHMNGDVRFYDLYENYTTAFELDGKRLNEAGGHLSKAAHTLKLVPKAGYKFPAYAKTTWIYPDIRDVVVESPPYFHPFIPEYTIPGADCNPCKNTYYVNGKATAGGDYQVAPGTKISITVKAPEDADWTLAEPTSWVHTFPGGGPTAPTPGTPKTLKSAQPRISGTAQIGKKLTAQAGDWTAGTTLRYQWKADDKDIQGATSATFTPGVAQWGSQISVRIKGSKNGYASTSRTSSDTSSVRTGTLAVSAPKILGTPRVGKTLKAETGSWTAGTKLKHQWYANGKAIKSATTSTYKPTASVKGKSLSVKVTGKKAGYASASKTTTSAKVKTGILSASKPKIKGTPRVGKKLTVDAGSWTSGTKLTYRWYVNGKRITGATGSTLKVSTKFKGKQLSVKVSGTKTGYSAKSWTSSKTAKITRR